MSTMKTVLFGLLLLVVHSSVILAGFPSIVELGTSRDVSHLEISGAYMDGRLGQGLSHGDFNGDGIQDIIAGAYCASPDDRTNAGAVYVIWGSEGLDASRMVDLANPSINVLEVWGNEQDGQLGSQVCAGDVNGDGYDDLVMGAWHVDGLGRLNSGAVYVLLGSASLDETGVIGLSDNLPNVITIFGAVGGSESFVDEIPPLPPYVEIIGGSGLGSSVDAGDINGDGYDDLLLGAQQESPLERYDAGADYVILGGPDFGAQTVIDLGIPDTADMTFYGQMTFQGYGSQLGFDGDVNDIDGDGYEDLILGARFADYNSLQDCGEVYIVWGAANIEQNRIYDLTVHNPGITVLHGSARIDYAGARLESGDVNGDGYLDILIDAYGARHNGAWYGKAYVVHGGPYLRETNEYSLVAGDNVLEIWGQEIGSSFGKPSAGDINGDGVDDLLVQGDRQGDDTGKAFIIWGGDELNELSSIDLAQPHHEITGILGAHPEGKLGYLSDAADINNDGYEDIIYSSHISSMSERGRCGALQVIWGMPHEPGEVDSCYFHVRDTSGPTSTVQIASTFDISGLTSDKRSVEIGFFTSNDVCAGQGIWSGEALSITVYGDPGDQNKVTGFLTGERYRVRIWIPYLGIESEILPYFADGEGYFLPSGTSVMQKSALAGPIGIDDGSDNVPHAIELRQNYPNPFNPVTTIPFSLSETGNVTLSIYNVLGERIDILADGIYSAGSHELVWDASDVSSGVYFCRLDTAGTVRTQRMLLVR